MVRNIIVLFEKLQEIELWHLTKTQKAHVLKPFHIIQVVPKKITDQAPFHFRNICKKDLLKLNQKNGQYLKNC